MAKNKQVRVIVDKVIIDGEEHKRDAVVRTEAQNAEKLLKRKLVSFDTSVPKPTVKKAND